MADFWLQDIHTVKLWTSVCFLICPVLLPQFLIFVDILFILYACGFLRHNMPCPSTPTIYLYILCPHFDIRKNLFPAINTRLCNLEVVSPTPLCHCPFLVNELDLIHIKFNAPKWNVTGYMGNWVIFNQFCLSNKYIALQSVRCNNYIQSGCFTLEIFYSNVDARCHVVIP